MIKFMQRTRTEEQLEDGSWRVHVVPPANLGLLPSDPIVLTADQYARYREWLSGSKTLQEILGDLSLEDREYLITGIGPIDRAAAVKRKVEEQMYIIITMDSMFRSEFWGPFPTEERAKEYARYFSSPVLFSTIRPMTVPFTVVRQVVWHDAVPSAV